MKRHFNVEAADELLLDKKNRSKIRFIDDMMQHKWCVGPWCSLVVSWEVGCSDRQRGRRRGGRS